MQRIRSKDSTSRRLFLGGFSFLPTLASLSKGDLSYAQYNKKPKYTITSPLNTYVQDVLVVQSQAVKPDQDIAVLDLRHLELELDRTNFRAVNNSLKAEKLTDAYIKDYVTSLMEGNQSNVEKSVAAFQSLFDQTDTQFKVGQVYEVDLKKVEAALLVRKADLSAAKEALRAKLAQIEVEKLKVAATTAEIANSMTIIETQTKLRKIRTPVGGKVNLHCAAGVFVERGDVLFEIF